MFRNYIKTTLRNLLNNAFYAFINITGLGMALAVCIVAYINNKYDYDFDSQHVNRDLIYKIGINRPIQARIQPYGITPMALSIPWDSTSLKAVSLSQILNNLTGQVMHLSVKNLLRILVSMNLRVSGSP